MSYHVETFSEARYDSNVLAAGKVARIQTKYQKVDDKERLQDNREKVVKRHNYYAKNNTYAIL